jgi:hypothetical protein
LPKSRRNNRDHYAIIPTEAEMNDEQYKDIAKMAIARCDTQFRLAAQLLEDEEEVVSLAMTVAAHFVRGAKVVMAGFHDISADEAEIRLVKLLLLTLGWQGKKKKRGSAVL